MSSRRGFPGAWAATLALFKSVLSRASRRGKPQCISIQYSDEIGRFWLLHLRYKNARGRNAQRFQINRELIGLAFLMKDQGVPLETIRAVAHEGLAQALADYGSQRDPFSQLAAA